MSSPQDRIELRAATDADADDLAAIQAAQDIAWWGTPDGDVDDLRGSLDRARLGGGSLDDATRVAVRRTVGGESLVGHAMLFAHGQCDVAVDPSDALADEAGEALVAWLIAAGATQVDSPAQDGDRRQRLQRMGLVASRSSFDLERPASVGDLGPTVWPDGIAPAPFRFGVDDEEVHDLVYSVWTDVPGHTHRPIDEWRALFLDDTAMRSGLAVIARLDDGGGPVAGAALCRTFAGDVGWVSQLAVGHSARGRGLGRSLLVESLRRLSAMGVTVLGLSVEAENAAALGLYRSVGLEVAREWVHYTTP